MIQTQNKSQFIHKYFFSKGRQYFKSQCQEIMKKKNKKKGNKNDNKIDNDKDYSIINIVKTFKNSPKLSDKLLAKQLQKNLVNKKNDFQKKEQYQLALYQDLQKTQKFKKKYVNYVLKKLFQKQNLTLKNLNNIELINSKIYIKNLFHKEIQTVLNTKLIQKKKLQTKVRQIDSISLNFICFSSFLLSLEEKIQQRNQVQQWRLNIKNKKQVKQQKNISIDVKIQEKRENYIKKQLINSIPFYSSIRPNLKITKQWRTDFVQKQQKQMMKKKITGKLLYNIQQKGRLIAQNKLKLYHFKKQKKLSLACLKNTFYKNLRIRNKETNNSIFQMNLNNKDTNQSVNKFKKEENIQEINRNSFDSQQLLLQNKQQKYFNVSIAERQTRNMSNFSTQNQKQKNFKINNINFLYNIKNKSKKSPISIAALDQFSYSKNFKVTQNKFNGKKNAFFNKPFSKNINKEKIEALFCKNKTKQIVENKSDFYPIYVSRLKIQSQILSYLEYECQNLQIKYFTSEFLADRIIHQQNNIIIVIPGILNKQNQQKLKKMVKIVVSLGGQLKLRPEDPYKQKNKEMQLELMTYQFLTKVRCRQIIEIIQLQKQLTSKQSDY